MSKMPPPITKHSSAKDMWEEIEALREEVSAQQSELNSAKKMAERLMQEASFYSYQLDIIRQVMSRHFGEKP